MHTLILGCGFSGMRIGRELLGCGTVFGTRRSAAGVAELTAFGLQGGVLDVAAAQSEEGGQTVTTSALEKPDPFDSDQDAQAHGVLDDILSGLSGDMRGRFEATTHLVSSVAPARTLPLDDPMLRFISAASDSGLLPRLRWIGYLSTIGVYGDHAGQQVDEDTVCLSRQPRSLARREAEIAWQQFAAERKVPTAVLRLSGIYGPGRNAVRDARRGRSRMLIKPDQVFNRIHVDDLACAVKLAAGKHYHGVLNITDDRPAPPQDVIRFAHGLVGRSPPPAVDFASAELSPMARSFYSENKRVDNSRSRRELGIDYAYPDYRIGLGALAADD